MRPFARATGAAVALAIAVLAAVAANPAAAWELYESPYFSAFGRMQELPSGAILASTYGGVFVSRDDGASWQFTGLSPLDDGNAAPLLHFDATELDDGTVFLVAEQAYRATADLTGMTALLHWPSSLESVVCSGDTLWAASEEEIFRSLDRGENWESVYIPPSGQDELAGLMRNPADGTVVTELLRGGGLFLVYSQDGGETWTFNQIAGVYGFMGGMRFAPDGTLWFTHNYLGDGVLRTTDDHGDTSQIIYEAPSNRTLEDLTLGPADRIAMVQNNFTLVSTDGGQSFQQVDTPFVRPEPLLYTQGGHLLGGRPDGLQRSADDGQTWSEVTTGLWANDLVDVAMQPDGTAWLLGSGRLWHDAAGPWTRLDPPEGGTDLVQATSGDRLLVLGRSGGAPHIHYTDDHGATWHAATGLDQLGTYQRFLSVVERAGTLYAGHRDLGLLVSADQGASWQQRSADATGAVAIGGDGTFWMSSDQGLSVSTDQGQTWSAVTDVTLVDRGVASPISGAFVAPGWSAVYRFTDAGATWDNIRSNLDDALGPDHWLTRVASLAFDGEGRLYAAVEALDGVTARGEVRILRSADDGDTFEDVTGAGGIDRTVVDHLEQSAAGEMIAATNQGLYRDGGTGGEVGVEDGPALASAPVHLGPAHPNPFNPRTVIPFRLPRAVHVRLTVTDLRGARVATLVDRVLPGGEHAVPFQGARLGSGIYVYRLQAGNIQRSGKMTLLK